MLAAAQVAFGCCTEIEARAALESGQFDLAASAAPQLGTTQARLIAAEALSAKVLLGLADDGKDTAALALAHASSVLTEDPENAEAQFQYALADGFMTRASSPFKAWRKKLPQKTKATVDALVLSMPDDPRAHALLGAWHIGIIRKTGEKNGEKWFGANAELGRAAYEKSLSLRPDDIIISSNYAVSFAELDFERYGPQARSTLQAVLASTPRNAIEAEVQLRMKNVLELWEDDTARDQRIERFLDGDG